MGVAKAPLWQGPDGEVDQIFCGENAADTQYPVSYTHLTLPTTD